MKTFLKNVKKGREARKKDRAARKRAGNALLNLFSYFLVNILLSLSFGAKICLFWKTIDALLINLLVKTFQPDQNRSLHDCFSSNSIFYSTNTRSFLERLSTAQLIDATRYSYMFEWCRPKWTFPTTPDHSYRLIQASAGLRLSGWSDRQWELSIKRVRDRIPSMAKPGFDLTGSWLCR